MWILILVVSVVLFFGLIILAESNLVSDWDDLIAGIGVFMLIPTIVSLLGVVWTGIIVASGSTVGEKIELYQSENKKIEQEIDQVVKSYMDYETETFKNSKTESSITLVSLYPELKSDELVKKQIEVYLKNKDTITNLKEKKISLKVSRWWLYFGK